MSFHVRNIVAGSVAVTLTAGLLAPASAQALAPTPAQLNAFCARVEMVAPDKLTGEPAALPVRPSDAQIRTYCRGLGFTVKEATTEVAAVSVIGTYLRPAGPVTDGAVNIESTSREEMLRNGSPTMEQLIRNLTESGLNENGDNRGQNSFGVGIRTINLRNLGAGRTLILFDGVRLADDPQTNGGPGISRDPNVQGGGAQNVNNIPLEVLASVEILKDGGSSAYGGDASGGAVNFTPRRDLNGFEASVSLTAGIPLILPALLIGGVNAANR